MTEYKIDHCPDCDAMIGEKHAFGCDIERCTVCGAQYITCPHSEPEHDKHKARWLGELTDDQTVYVLRDGKIVINCDLFLDTDGWLQVTHPGTIRQGAVNPLAQWFIAHGREIEENGTYQLRNVRLIIERVESETE